jgi:predicted enzyme related to lactoylglutathione lyase
MGKDNWKPSPDGPSVGFEVVDFDTAIAELKAKHVPFDLEPMETPVCRMAVIADPDGNKLTVHKRHG